jgi:hypothetical protein
MASRAEKKEGEMIRMLTTSSRVYSRRNRKILTSLSVILLLVSFSIVLSSETTQPKETTMLYIAPEYIKNPEDPISGTPIQPYPFTIDINVSNVVNLYGFDLTVRYNTIPLDAVAVRIFPGRDGSEYMIIKNEINDTEGYVRVAASLLAPTEPLTGNATLVEIDFVAEADGDSLLDLCESNLAESDGKLIPHKTKDSFYETRNFAHEPRDLKVQGFANNTKESLNLTVHTPDLNWSFYDPYYWVEYQEGYNVSVWNITSTSTLMWYEEKTGTEGRNVTGVEYPVDAPQLCDGCDYELRVKTLDSRGAWSSWAWMRFHLNTKPPIPREPIFPINTQTNVYTYELELTWSCDEDAEGSELIYEWVLDLDSPPQEPYNYSGVGSTNNTKVTYLEPSKSYYWKVRSYDGYEYSEGWSELWSFSTGDYEPKWRNQGTNDSNNIVRWDDIIILSAHGIDDNNLTLGELWTNESGSWARRAEYGILEFGAARAEWKVAKFYWRNSSVENSTVVGWKIKFIDGSDNYNYTDVMNFIIHPTGDVAVPKWRNQAQTAEWIHPEGKIVLSAEGFDEQALAWAILETDETGIWRNCTDYGSPRFLNNAKDRWVKTSFTWQNDTIDGGTTVRWRIWYEDAAGKVNCTPIKSFSVTTLLWKVEDSGSIKEAPVIVDVNNDDYNDVIFGTNDRLWAFNGLNGSLLWKSELTYRGYAECAPVVADFNKDGILDIVAWDGSRAAIYYSNNGSLYWEVQVVPSEDYVHSSPAVADLNFDEVPDIVVVAGMTATYKYLKVVALDGRDGTILWSYVGDNPISRYPRGAAIADLNLDGIPEIVVGTSGDPDKLYAIYGNNGTLFWSRTVDTELKDVLAIANISGDDYPEVIIGTYNTYDPEVNYLYAIHGNNGTILWSQPMSSMVRGSPVLADFNKDGRLEIVVAEGNSVKMLSSERTIIWETLTKYEVSYPVIAEANNDGWLDIIVIHYPGPLALDGRTGEIIYQYPGGSSYARQVAVADLNNDGILDLVFGYGSTNFRVWAYTTLGGKGGEWRMFGLDAKCSNVLLNQTLTLRKGWNTLVLPRHQSYASAKDLATLLSATYIVKYDTERQMMITFSKGLEANNFNIRDCVPYLVYVSTELSINITGTPIQCVGIELSEGWNYLPWLSENDNASTLKSTIESCTVIAYYNNTLGRFIQYDGLSSDFVLQYGKGYFVYVTTSSRWVQ